MQKTLILIHICVTLYLVSSKVTSQPTCTNIGDECRDNCCNDRKCKYFFFHSVCCNGNTDHDQKCNIDSDCCSGMCRTNTAINPPAKQCYCYPDEYESCETSNECCSGKCVSSKCITDEDSINPLGTN
uniref:Uncharacterized protein n=1 Tax=Clytia hemisphaerica TaxID=252671 RepID=A0A7M5X6T5_9CNID|eukprot:TCONS_00053289-protein